MLVVSETTPDGKAAPGKVAPAKVEYWDYWRNADIGAGKTAKEFVFVKKMNSDTRMVPDMAWPGVLLLRLVTAAAATFAATALAQFFLRGQAP